MIPVFARHFSYDALNFPLLLAPRQMLQSKRCTKHFMQTFYRVLRNQIHPKHANTLLIELVLLVQTLF